MKQDLRVRKTKIKIRRALVELINEEGFQKLSVTDLIKQAHINRSTFYAHYLDKYDLLEKVKQEIYDQIQLRLEKIPAPVPQNDKSKVLGAVKDDTYQVFRESANLLYQYRDLIGALELTGNFYSQIKKILVKTMRQRRQEFHVQFISQIPADYAEELIINSMLDLVIFWLEKDHPESPQEFAKILTRSRELIPFQLMEAEK